MKIPFRILPGRMADVPRPLVDIDVEGLAETSLTCLLETGSLHNRFAAWVAHEAGLDLRAIEPESLGVGGRPVIARTLPVGLRVGGFAWEAPVSFCEPWPWDFQLLGQEGFLRYFRVTMQAGDRWLEVKPARRP